VTLGLNHTVTYGDTFEDIWPASLPGGMVYMQRNMGNGAAVADYDGDGDLDVYLAAQLDNPNALFQNQLIETGSLAFIDVAAAAGVDNLGHTRTPMFVDLDNDGWLDLILANDSISGGGHSPSAIYQNLGDGSFADVTSGSGFAPLGLIKGGMGVTDYDADGLLDIYVTNWKGGPAGNMLEGHSYLYRNLGGFLFEDTSLASGLGELMSNAFTPIFADFDNDGDSDLYQAIDGLPDFYFRNTGGQFVDATGETNATHVGSDMGVAVLDFDGDGDLDVYTCNATDPYGNWGGNTLQINSFSADGNTFFDDDAWGAGVANTGWGWGVEWVDCDNDGAHELFVVNGFDEWLGTGMAIDVPGFPDTEELLMGVRSFLFGQIGGGQFTELKSANAAIVSDARATIAFDADRDGDMDLLITNIDQPVSFLLNQTTDSHHWLDIKLQGSSSNRDGVGARVRVSAGGAVAYQDLIGGGSYMSGRPFELHFGMGNQLVADELRVFWPDGKQTVVHDVASDQMITVQQDGDLNAAAIHATLGRPGSAGFDGALVTQMPSGSWRAAMLKLTSPGDVTLTDLDLLAGTNSALSKADISGLQLDIFSDFQLAQDMAAAGQPLSGDLAHLELPITPADLGDWTLGQEIHATLPQYCYRVSGLNLPLDTAQEVWLAVQWTGDCATPGGCIGPPVSTLEGQDWRLLSPDLPGEHWVGAPSLALTAWTQPTGACSAALYGSGWPGSGGLVPAFSFEDCPAAGDVFSLSIADILGGSTGLMLLGFEQAATPIGNSGCTLNVSPVLPINYSLPVGGVGAGGGQVNLQIPFPASASGFHMTTQVFFADPASPIGYSATGGLEIIIP